MRALCLRVFTCVWRQYYTELPDSDGTADAVLADMIREMVTHFLEPERNKLEPPN